MARNSPVTICVTGQIPDSDLKFHQPLIVDGVAKSTRASFAILNKGCLFRVGLLIVLCVVVVPLIRRCCIRLQLMLIVCIVLIALISFGSNSCTTILLY